MEPAGFLTRIIIDLDPIEAFENFINLKINIIEFLESIAKLFKRCCVRVYAKNLFV